MCVVRLPTPFNLLRARLLEAHNKHSMRQAYKACDLYGYLYEEQGPFQVGVCKTQVSSLCMKGATTKGQLEV